MKFKVKELREKNGLKQYEVAKLLNLSAANYGKIENEQVTLTLETAISLSKIFNCSLNEIAGLPVIDEFSLAGYKKQQGKNVEFILFIKDLDDK